MASVRLVGCVLATLASWSACSDRAPAAPAASPAALPDGTPVVLDWPDTAPAAPSWLVLRGGLGGPLLPAVGGTVDPCVVRAGGEQRTLGLAARAGAVGVEIPLPLGAGAVVGLSVGATPQAGAFHAKTILPGEGGEDAAAVVARLGLLAELTPLVDPRALRPGDDLPVKLAVDLGVATDVEVAVDHRPARGAAVKSTVRTGEGGIATVRVPGPGTVALSARVHVGTLGGSTEEATTSLTFVVGGAAGGEAGGKR